MRRRSFLSLAAVAVGRNKRRLLDGSERLTFNSLGPVKIGMNESQLRSVLAHKLERSDYEAGCSYVEPDADGIAFMLLDSRVARIDVSKGHWLTQAGAGIGTTEATLRRLYPNVRVEPHPYLDTGEGYYFRVSPTNAKRSDHELVFETFDNSVTSFRAGLSKAVGLIEGCS